MTLFAAGSRYFSARNIKLFLPLLVFVAISLLIGAIYFSSFRKIEILIQDQKLRDLGAIADMKAGQIAAWRETHIRLAESFTSDSILAAEFGQWLREGMPSNGRKQRLRQMLTELQHVNGYKSILLLDRQGTVRLSLKDYSILGAEDARLAEQAMDRREEVLSDFYRHDYGDKEVGIILTAPLTIADGNSGRVVGAVVLQIDPHTSLYPLINAWPTRSASAETLLVRRDGDDVLFLNDVRHRKGTALDLRIPLNTSGLPSAMAIRGMLSTTEGVDYRGIPVVSEMRQVSGMPWFVVSKIDREELFAPVNRLKQWSTALWSTLVAIGGLLVFVWLRVYRARFSYLQAQHAAAVEREMLVKHFEYLTRYANDIIIVTDGEGNIVEANERAQQAYGYTRDEMLRMRVPDFRDPAEDRTLLQRQLEQLRRFGELRYETVNLRKDRTRFPVEVSARLIEVKGTRYVQGIIRDISERRRTEEALRKSEILLKESQQMAHIGSWEMDLKNNILYWSDENYRIFEVDPARFGASYEAFLDTVHPDDREMVNRAYTDSVNNRTPYTIIHRLQFPDQRVKYVQEWCETYYDEEGSPLRSIGTTQDITAQQLAQNELRASARQIEDLYNRAPCGYHSLDNSGVIVQINDTELQWLGYAREEMTGKMGFADLLTPASLEVFRSNYPGFKQRGFVHDLEYELVRKDGTTFFVSLSATAVRDADGQYLMSRSTMFDITARKQAEEELRLHGAILSQVEEGVSLVRADAGTVVYANPKLEQMFGYAAGEMTGMHVSRLNAPAAKNPEETALEIMAALKDKGRWVGEIVNLRKDGTPFWCHASVSTFEHHSYGTVWVSTHEDITDRKLAEKKLGESEERFRAMADNAPIMIWVADVQDRQAYQGRNFCNKRWHEFTGLPFDQTHVCNWLQIVHADDRKRCLDAYTRAFRKAGPFKLEYRLRRYDGVFRWVLDSGVPRFTGDGKLLGFIGTCLDITDHKLFEEIRAEVEHASRINIAGEMVSGLTHELSQPLTAANNYLDACLRRMAEKDWDRDSLQKKVRLAQAQTDRAGKIINHLKGFVRKQKQEHVILDVNTLVRDTVNFLEYEFQHHFVTTELDLSPLPLTLGSRIEVEQVLINLVSNAIDSMSSSPRRELRITTRVIESGAILITVSDTGKGIAADDLDKIFNPFHSTKKNGLGLGLAICRSLVENNGGQIWAEQNGDAGAEFNFTIPVGVTYD
jgi:PAS domain S-box-containing protein